MKSTAHLLLILIMLIGTGSLRAETVRVAVASNFIKPMKALAEAFEADGRHTLKVSSGSSGLLYAQLSNGAPFDVFLSADQDKPQALEKNGLTVPGSRFTYASGSLALWSAEKNVAVSDGEILKSDSSGRMAIANPKVAPYGVAALETMQSLGVQDLWKRRLVQGENIAQTFQFVSTGNARFGFVAASQLPEGENSGSAWIIPPELHSPIRQDAVLMAASADNSGAVELMGFLKRAEAMAIIKSFGYR